MRLNGEPHDLSLGISIQKLVDDLGLDTGRIAVEWNHRIVQRADLRNAVILDGDLLEIVTFVGGG